MPEPRLLLPFLRRRLCALRGHGLFVDYYGRFDGEYVCLGCGKRKVVTEETQARRPATSLSSGAGTRGETRV